MTSDGATEHSRKTSQPSIIDSSGNSVDSGVDRINGFISSMKLERSNTKAGLIGSLMRRKTLMKQAEDPEVDQEALEQEIRHVERLASLLGRRQTRFSHKREPIKVNHDLDATLDGFFDVQDEDRLGDLLLTGGHKQTADAQLADDSGESVADPELKQKNINTAPTALIASQQEGQYSLAEDPFDKIEQMQLEKSLSESVEYLSMDTYASDDDDAEMSSDAVAGGKLGNRVVAGKLAGGVDQILDTDMFAEDDGLVAGIGRSNTWKRQSMVLIQEREKYGP
ncbi:hypothetical protein GGF37_003969, partial [Kickxella alabastrina]